jgi:hypothetical protein
MSTVSSAVKTETTVTVSPRVFDELEVIKHEPMTEDEKTLDFDSLHLNQDEPGENSKLSLGVKRSHFPDSEMSLNSTAFPSRKRVEVDDTEIDRNKLWDEFGWKAEREAAFGAHDLATQDAAHNLHLARRSSAIRQPSPNNEYTSETFEQRVKCSERPPRKSILGRTSASNSTEVSL